MKKEARVVRSALLNGSARWWKTLNQGRTKQCLFLVEREKRYRKRMSRSCQRCFLATVEEGCQGEAKRKEAEKVEEEEKECRERQVRFEIVQKVVADIERQVDIKPAAQRTVGQSVKQSWDCSQIENEEEDETEDWQKEDPMLLQWAEDEKLEEVFERRKMEGDSLQAEVMQKVPGLVVHERMSQGKTVKGTEEKKNVKGWSTEEMKDKPSSSWEDDTEEMRTWRSSNQEEMDQCWKIWQKEWSLKFLTSTRLRTGQLKGVLQRRRLPAGMEARTKKQQIQDTKVVRRLLGKNLRFVQRIQRVASAKQAKGGVNEGRRDEAAGTNEDHEGKKQRKLDQKEGWTP